MTTIFQVYLGVDGQNWPECGTRQAAYCRWLFADYFRQQAKGCYDKCPERAWLSEKSIRNITRGNARISRRCIRHYAGTAGRAVFTADVHTMVLRTGRITFLQLLCADLHTYVQTHLSEYPAAQGLAYHADMTEIEDMAWYIADVLYVCLITAAL